MPSCTPECLGDTFCYAPGACATLPSWRYVDGGPVEVTGGLLVPLIRMWWDAPAAVYESDPPPGGPQLFVGGEDLEILGGTGDFAFCGDIPAPKRVALWSPDPNAHLQLPVGVALQIAWTSEETDEIEVLITASGDSGAAEIRCVTSDTGALTIPADLMGALPSPPRQTRFEILRTEQRFVPIARAGAGVLVHAAQSTWMNGSD
jgi:hypothetical protein